VILDLVFTTIRIATPLVFAALGGLLTYQAGILNIALDGFMLIGAFVGIWVAFLTGNLAVAVGAAALAGVLVALLFGLFNLKLKANIFIAGIAVNLLASGLTALLLKGVLGQNGVFASSSIPTFPRLDLPLVSSVPLLRDTLSGHTLLVYLAFLLVPVVSYCLYRTKWGLRVRAVGEAEDAALTAGIPVFGLKLQTVLLSGFFCGLGGAYLSLGYVSLFSRDMTAERGLIAMAAIFFARGVPLRTTLVALLFGASQAVTVQLQQSAGVAPQLIQTIPYVVTVIALVIVGVQVTRAYGAHRGDRFDV
jgi:simple sugar transport system permease protein